MGFDPAQELARLRTELADAQRNVAVLEALIEVLEREGSAQRRPAGANPARARSAVVDRYARTKRPAGGRRGRAPGGKGQKQVLRELMADGERRDVPAMKEQLLRDGVYTEATMPKDASFKSRLGELRGEGYLTEANGFYQLASSNGTGHEDEPSLLAEGGPNPESQKGKPPRPMSAHGGGGHPTGGESAEAASGI
jgi:hypothetical protein